MRCYLNILALALAGTLLPLEHVQAHYLRTTDSNKGECAALFLLAPIYRALPLYGLPPRPC